MIKNWLWIYLKINNKNLFVIFMYCVWKFHRIKIIFMVELLAGICFWYVCFDLWSTFIILSCIWSYFTAFFSSSSHLEHYFKTCQGASTYILHLSTSRVWAIRVRQQLSIPHLYSWYSSCVILNCINFVASFIFA